VIRIFTNTGARDSNGHRIPSKKKLRELLASDASSVSFDCTAMNQEGRIIRGDDIPPGMTLVVVLPDPYENRRFYANVFIKADGSLVVR
jgi:hypothetical protein